MTENLRLFFTRLSLQTALLIILGATIFLYWYWLQQGAKDEGYPIYRVAVLWVLVLSFCLWLGNLLIYRFIQRAYSWESSFSSRFFLQLVLTLFFSLGCINLTYILFKNAFTQLPPDQNQLILLNIYGTLFLVPVLSVQFGLLFLRKWKMAIIEQEKLKKEQVQSELFALRSHLSPHFLFNNLNILSALIEVENQPAQDYLDRFAQVYRYVLKNREIELISLSEELRFLESYNFLLQQRFSKALQIDIQVAPSYQDYLLPPLSLQMLIENALKHNKLSEKKPLQIKITTEDQNTLSVINNLQTKTLPPQEKTGFGLENIRRRYWLIARQEIDWSCTAAAFKVGLPLIKHS
ncbi:MAG: histidine kinase [Cyanothece sp. SIO1E1]|nr:histidine kinase [Cyanothece sp. SIO1E1]